MGHLCALVTLWRPTTTTTLHLRRTSWVLSSTCTRSRRPSRIPPPAPAQPRCRSVDPTRGTRAPPLRLSSVSRSTQSRRSLPLAILPLPVPLSLTMPAPTPTSRSRWSSATASVLSRVPIRFLRSLPGPQAPRPSSSRMQVQLLPELPPTVLKDTACQRLLPIRLPSACRVDPTRFRPMSTVISPSSSATRPPCAPCTSHRRVDTSPPPYPSASSSSTTRMAPTSQRPRLSPFTEATAKTTPSPSPMATSSMLVSRSARSSALTRPDTRPTSTTLNRLSCLSPTSRVTAPCTLTAPRRWTPSTSPPLRLSLEVPPPRARPLTCALSSGQHCGGLDVRQRRPLQQRHAQGRGHYCWHC